MGQGQGEHADITGHGSFGLVHWRLRQKPNEFAYQRAVQRDTGRGQVPDPHRGRRAACFASKRPHRSGMPADGEEYLPDYQRTEDVSNRTSTLSAD